MSDNNILWSPLKYGETAVVAREASQEMVSRLDWVTLEPRVILDLGCGTGESCALLHKRYPNAKIIALDTSFSMLAHAQKTYSFMNCVCADGGVAPIKNQSVDLIFANFLLPWHTKIVEFLKECRRLLRPDGLLMFTALGPDTLKEWQEFFATKHLPNFIDMHDIGDALLEIFSDPVLDVSHFTLSYRDKNQLLQELISSGMWFPEKQNDLQTYANKIFDQDEWEVTYEVIYGHAFAPAGEHTQTVEGVTKIPLNKLRQQLSNKS